MSTINERIYDRIIDHMSDVRLYEEGVQIGGRRIIRRHREKLSKLLRNSIKSDVAPEVRRFNKEMSAHLKTNIKEFSTQQIDFHTGNMYKEVKDFYKVQRPRSRELLAEVTGTGMRGEKSLLGNVRNISAGELVRIQSKVKAGLASGMGKNEIIADVLKTTKLTEVQAKTLTRTAITSTQTAALNYVAQNNKDILKGYVFTAVLDTHTSPICTHHNGNIYDIDDTRFLPPLHWNCRSSLVPVLKSKQELQAIKSDRIKKQKLAKKDDALLNGVAPKKETFHEWLKRQTMEVQTKMLGSEEAMKMFREGKLAAKEFITPKGKALSITALRRKAAEAVQVFRPRQKIRENDIGINARSANVLVNNPKNVQAVQELFILDSDDYSKTLSLTDFKGTTLAGKTASRRRVGNEFDESNFSADPLTGEIRNNNLYDPDFNLLTERLDFMDRSKVLSKDHKDFIRNVVNGLDDKVSTNQQTVIVENLRVVFERQINNKDVWQDLPAVIRAENRFSVQNTSRLLDVRSRKDSEMFVSYMSKGADTPTVQIMGQHFKLDDLIESQLADQRFIDNWRATEGKVLANKLYYKGRAPLRVYLRKYRPNYPEKKEIIKKLKSNIPFKEEYDKFVKMFNREPSDDWIVKQAAKIRETYRGIVDLEFLNRKQRPTSLLFDDKNIDSLTKMVKLVASGQTTDYDGLAIKIGESFANDFKDLVPFLKHTTKDFHKEGSAILEELRKQGLIRVQFRGKVRRGVLDLDTGRASGGWGDTISREVIVVDKELLKLQLAERKVTIARRIGVINDRDRLYVKANNKVFFDARGNKTGIPIISRDKFPDYDPAQIDADMANMMNHVTNVEYEVDPIFFDFMDDVVRFRDPRGNSKYYDSINELRHEILKRNEQGYGLMATAKFHRQRGKPFRTQVFIDSRGRVYHRGYLTPTGGELVRPFINSAQEFPMTPIAVDELRIQTGALIGPGTEALTQAGRREIFKRNEQNILSLGRLLQQTTQRDRRIREFLEHPLINGLEAAEVPKMSRLALEYARVYDHVNGDFSDVKKLATYKTKLMIENDASSSGAQIIALSTGDRPIAEASNVVATTQKNRLYDLVAMDTVDDPEFLAIPVLRDANLTWEDLAKAAKAQNMVEVCHV